MEASLGFLPEPGGLPRPRLFEFGDMEEPTEGDNAKETEPSCPYFLGLPLFLFRDVSPEVGGGAATAEESTGEDSICKGGDTNPVEPPP